MPIKTPSTEIQPPDWGTITPQQWSELRREESDRAHQASIVPFLQWAYALFSTATFAIFFLQGFHCFGFSLDVKVLLALCGVTVGEIGGLLILIVRFVFGRGTPRHSR